MLNQTDILVSRGNFPTRNADNAVVESCLSGSCFDGRDCLGEDSCLRAGLVEGIAFEERLLEKGEGRNFLVIPGLISMVHSCLMMVEDMIFEELERIGFDIQLEIVEVHNVL